MNETEPDVLANMTFSKEYRARLHSTNPIDRIEGEIKRCTDDVGILPNDEAIIFHVGAILLEQNDQWTAHCKPAT